MKRCRNLILCSLAVAGLTMLPSAARAGSVPPGKDIQFLGGSGGTFTYSIGVGSTAGVHGAPMDTVISFPSFTSLGIDSGQLDFTTGPCIATCGEATVGGFAQSVPQFGAGGGLTLYGGIPSLGIADGTALIDGTFVPFTDAGGHTHPAAAFSLFANPGKTSGMDGYLQILSVNPELLSFFNFNPSFTGGEGHLSELLLQLTFVAPTWNGQIEHSSLLVDPALPEPPS